MNIFKLIYFNGCPNYGPAKKLLEQVGVEFSEVCQNELDESDPYMAYSSPTLLMNDRVIFGSKTSGAGGGCSLNLPSPTVLLKALKDS